MSLDSNACVLEKHQVVRHELAFTQLNWVLASALVATLLTACGGGGGGGGSDSTTPSLSISGVAATGAAISGGTVDATCQAGTGTATTNADGSYMLSVSAGKQPCILRATDPITKLELHSLVETGATTANITPITDLVVANTLGADPAAAYINFTASMQLQVTSSKISEAVTKVQAATAALGASADMSGIDPMKGTLQAATANVSGDATDKKIDALMAALAAADKKIADLSAVIKASNSTTDAASKLTTLVGSARYSLSGCPAARSGDIWVMDFTGTAPGAWNVDYSTLVLKNLADNSTSVIVPKLDAQSNAIPCAYTSVINNRTVEFRVSDSGLAIWKHNSKFGITIPKQTSVKLDSSTFAGSYPSIAYLAIKQTGFNAAAPFRYEIDATGKIDAYSCDMSSKPKCSTLLTPSSNNKTTCIASSNGTLSCQSADGKLQGIGVGFVSGGSATLFLVVTDFTLNSSASAGGLIVMTKAASMKLPVAGTQVMAGATWYAGLRPVSGGCGSSASSGVLLSNVVPAFYAGCFDFVSGDSSAGTVENVDASADSFITSTPYSAVTTTSYLNTPSTGFLYSTSSAGASAVTIGSTSGWSFSIAKSSSTDTAYNQWYGYVRMNR
jgi:hypothetical protein